jgi:hypothetical protein
MQDSTGGLYESIVVGLLQDLTGFVLPGYHTVAVLSDAAARALYQAVASRRSAQKQVDALAALSPARAWEIAEPFVRNSGLKSAEQEEILRYLSAVPMSCRRAVRRWNDKGRVTTLVSQLPRTPGEAARFVPLRPPRFMPGHRVPNTDLQLDLLLGQGGFGEVWRARNVLVPEHPKSALKFCFETALMPSLQREIRLLAKLSGGESDKDFVRLLHTAYGADPPFLEYEYVDGGDLEGWMLGFGDQAPPATEVVSVLKMVARALAFAHERGIVHCDLKPSNLLVTREGRVKVADLGVGHVTAQLEAEKAREGIASGERAVTPMYADELRDPRLPPDPQDDVYAIGVIGFQLLVGRLVRPGGAWDEHLRRRGVPEAIVRAIRHCLLPPEDRFRNAGALLAALEAGRFERDQGPIRAQPEMAEQGRPEVRARAQRPRHCHHCGQALAESIAFCTNCGQRIGGG